MRKLIWGSTALAVAMAAAVYYTADYAARNPESFVGRCANAADYVGRALNPFSVLSDVVARHKAAQQTTQTPTPCGVDDEVAFVPKPKHECQVEQIAEGGDAVEPVEVIKIEPPEGIDPKALAEALGVRFHFQGAKAQEGEDEACEAQTQPVQVDASETREPIEYGIIPGPEDEEEGAAAVAAADGQQGPLTMPYAEDDEDDGSGCWGFCDRVRRLFRAAATESTTPVADTVPSESQEDATTTETLPPPRVEEGSEDSKTEEEQPSDDGAAKEEENQESERPSSDYHRYETCPYLHGCPYPYNSGYHCPSAYQPSSVPSTPEASTTTDNGQPTTPKKPRKVKKPANADTHPVPGPNSEDSAKHFDLDTLEYRPTDGDPSAYTNMWF